MPGLPMTGTTLDFVGMGQTQTIDFRAALDKTMVAATTTGMFSSNNMVLLSGSDHASVERASYGTIAAHVECVSNVAGPVQPSGSGIADVKTRSGSRRRLRARSRAALSP